MIAILYYEIIIKQSTSGNSSFQGKYKSVIASSSYRELQAKPEFVLVLYLCMDLKTLQSLASY